MKHYVYNTIALLIVNEFAANFVHITTIKNVIVHVKK